MRPCLGPPSLICFVIINSKYNSQQTVLLDSNNFTSLPSNFFVGLTILRVFTVSDNINLAPWGLPDYLTDVTNLQTFQASNANIVGIIPDIFSGLTNLQNLRLSYNNLTVSQVWLQVNSFSGAIPDLSNCSTLFDLQLRDNQLTGLVPASLVSLPKLANITLHNNKLQGPVPEFKSAVKVDKYENKNSFCLSKPGPCDPQKFSGSISPAFANLTSLRTLSLNDNNFVGTIPKELTSLPNLQSLNVSNNDLSGDTPVFPPTVKFSFGGNPNIGKDVSNTSGSGSRSRSRYGNAGGGSNGSKKGSPGFGMVIRIVISVIVFVVILMFVSYDCYAKKRKQKLVKVEDPESGKEIVKSSVIYLTIKHITSTQRKDQTRIELIINKRLKMCTF
ncbi:receptor-like kinase TMK4 [Tanacetum coccineum]